MTSSGRTGGAMTTVMLNLHDRKRPSIVVYADLPRVPVAGDAIHYEDAEYVVSTVVLYANGDIPYVVAEVPLSAQRQPA